MSGSLRSTLLRRSVRVMVRGLVVALLLVVVPAAAHGADRTARPIHEGRDTAPCVSSLEFDVVRLGASQLRVQRVWDTAGIRLDPSALDAVPDKYRAPEGHRDVRAYPVCPRYEDGVIGGIVFAEFDTSGRRHPLVFANYDEQTDWS